MTRQSTRRNTMAVSSAGVGAAPRQPEPGQAERDAAPRGRPAIPCGRPARDRHPRGPGGDGRQLPGERGDQGPRVRATLRPADRRGRLGTLRGRPRRGAGALLEPLRGRGGIRPGPQSPAPGEAARPALRAARRALHERRRRGAREGAPLRGAGKRPRVHRGRDERAERLRLRPALLLPAVRPDVRGGAARGEGPREPPRQGLREAAGVPGGVARRADGHRCRRGCGLLVARLDRSSSE